jgi:L-threonylcarbamoyladenylate synthase
LRLGPIAPDEIACALESDVEVSVDGKADGPHSPGQSLSHYAPSLPMAIDCREAPVGWAFLGFGPDCPSAKANLSMTGDLLEAGANLFAMLRALDKPQFAGIAVAPVPSTGIGAAINDRLRRAAQARR